MAKIALDHRTVNTVAAPLRVGGEIINGLANIPRQGFSGAKNVVEVQKQTWDALVDNFVNFSKVEGKRYQRLVKGTANLFSAVTRRPLSIGIARAASTINQGTIEPLKKIIFTPGKIGTGIKNAFSKIFSDKKGFDFQSYDTHETGKDTRIHEFKEQRVGFFGASSSGEKKPETPKTKKDEKPTEKKADTKSDAKKPKAPKEIEGEKNPEASKTEKISKKPTEKKPLGKTDKEKPKTRKELEDNHKKEAIEKDRAEAEKKERKYLDRKEKAEHEKEFKKTLDHTMTEDAVLARGKKEKKGENIDQILTTLKKEYPAFAGYIEEEILAKKAPASATA